VNVQAPAGGWRAPQLVKPMLGDIFTFTCTGDMLFVRHTVVRSHVRANVES